MNSNIAQTILQQLGGKTFIAMTGARHLMSTGQGLTFRLPSNFAKGGINLVTITLDPSDTYTVTFQKARGLDVAKISTHADVYAEDLQRLFTKTTGLDVSLGTVHRAEV